MPPKDSTDTALLKQDLKYLREGVDEIREELRSIRNEKVSRERFDLVNEEQNKRISNVERLVFGAVGLALMSMGKALIDIVIGRK